MRTLAIIFLLYWPAFGAVCTVTGTDDMNWDTPARWNCGRTPIPGTDTAVINTAVKVTIPAGTIAGAGNFAGTALMLNHDSMELVINGTLNIHGTLMLNGTSSKLTMTTVGSTRPTLNLMSTTGVTGQLVSAGNGAQTFAINGTPEYPALITTTPGTGLPGFLSMNIAGATGGPYFLWNNVEVSGLGSASQTALNAIRHLVGSNIYIHDSGRTIINGNGNNALSVDGLIIRNTLNTTNHVTIAMADAISGQVRQIKNLTVAGTDTQSFLIQSSNVLVQDAVFHRSFIQAQYLNAALRGYDQTYKRILWVGENGSTGDPQVLYFVTSSGSLLEDAAMLNYTATGGNSSVGHQVKFGGTAASTPNTFRRIVSECAGDHTGGGNRDGGDVILTVGKINVEYFIAANGCGNIYDGLHLTSVQNTKNVTLVDMSRNNDGIRGGFVLNEATSTNLAQGYLRNSLMVGAVSGIAQGGAFVRQTNAFEPRHNASYDLVSNGYLRHPANPQAMTYFERPATLVGTVGAPQAGSTSTSYIANGTGLGIIRGDYLKFNSWAIITNVEENQPVAGKTRLTLGTNILGTPGITLAGSENVYRAWWDDGAIYGEGTRGSGDLLNVNPHFVNRTADVAKYDALCGGVGTVANFSDEAIKRYGNRDKNGTPAAWNSCYSLEGVTTYLRNALAPRNPQLKSAGYSGDGSPDIGAVSVFLTHGIISGAMLQ